jgi:hypothetical protein
MHAVHISSQSREGHASVPVEKRVHAEVAGVMHMCAQFGPSQHMKGLQRHIIKI